MKETLIGRRSFLQGAALTGTGIALAGLVSCTSPEERPVASTGAQKSSAQQASEKAAAEGVHTWEVAPEAITDIASTSDYDIVIIGCGLAGLNAAQAASRNGASVAVVEQNETYSIRGADNGHLNSRFQREQGLNFDVDEAARLIHQWSNQTTSYNLIRTWASQSGRIFDYIEELVAADGVRLVSGLSPTAKYHWDTLDERWRVYPDACSFTKEGDTGMYRPDGSSIQFHLADALYNSALSNGAEFLFQTHAEQLVGDAANGVTGVIVTSADGSHQQINASKGVIISTGDIGGNQEMIDAWCPIANRADASMYAPPGANTGEGLLMGMWIGAAPSKSEPAPMIHQFTRDTIKFNLSSFVMCWLAVNRNGERYGSELPFEPYLTNARMNTPGNAAWSIFDADYAQYVEKQLPDTYQTILANMEETINEKIEEGLLLEADTLEDLADQLGIPASTFVQTVESYNKWYDQGHDGQFNVPERFLSQVKTPPFYAFPNVCSLLTIPYGLHVNDDSQVCTAEDKPIDGLYAIGNAQGDFFGKDYPVHYPGISLGRATTFGQLVGEALAKDTVITQILQ